MKDINKIKLVHEIREHFHLNDEIMEQLIDQIPSLGFRENIERFYKGYKIEDNFSYLFSALPYIRLLHGLVQNQLPSISKKLYQVPDYIIFYETSNKINRPILVEVKSVPGNRENLTIMFKQLNACIKYSNILNIPLLYGIYWQKYQYWTLNTIENFSIKKNVYKITILEAFANDLSNILGDFGFLFDFPICRQTICDQLVSESNIPKHEKYGAIISDKISLDNISYFTIEPIESAIIDSCIKMNIIKVEKNRNQTTITERNRVENRFMKLSTMILRYMATINLDLTEENSIFSRVTISNFLHKLRMHRFFSIPKDKTITSDKLFKEAFYNTEIYKAYSKVQK